MRRGVLILTTSLALAFSPGMAVAARLGGMGANIFGDSYFNFSHENLASPPVHAISVGNANVVLETTRLTDLQRRFGGTIQQAGGAESLNRWLCYTAPTKEGAPGAKVWFLTNTLGGGEFVMMVALEADREGHPSPDCPLARGDFSIPQLGIPTLGAKVAALKAHFGAARIERHNTVSYRNDRPSSDGLGTANTTQYLGYALNHGVVTGVGVGETSTR